MLPVYGREEKSERTSSAGRKHVCAKYELHGDQ